MTVYVVDLLEVIHVDQQHGERLAKPLRMGEGGFRYLHEVAPVVQASHPVDRSEFGVAGHRRPLSRSAANWRTLTSTVSTTAPSRTPPTGLMVTLLRPTTVSRMQLPATAR